MLQVIKIHKYTIASNCIFSRFGIFLKQKNKIRKPSVLLNFLWLAALLTASVKLYCELSCNQVVFCKTAQRGILLR